MKVAHWGHQMLSDVIIKILRVITSSSKESSQGSHQSPVGSSGCFMVIAWVITRTSQMVIGVITSPSPCRH
jgi:hypothetical protein